jgi:hypothetical protein
MTYILEPDGFGEPTIWKDVDGTLEAILPRYQIRDAETWRLIVGALCGEVPL